MTADAARDYAASVCAGKTVAGGPVRDACQRHIDDLAASGRGEAAGLYYDADAAAHALAFFSTVLRLGGEPFSLMPWQKFIVCSLFGWKRENGTRRFRRAYIETGKGSGKTPLAAGIALYMITLDGEHRAEGYVCARTMEQSLVTYRDMVAMVNDSPPLAKRLRVSGIISPYSIDHIPSGSFVKRIAANAAGEGRSGYRPHVIVMDEFHEQSNAATLDLLAAGVKARRQPLVLITTNAGVSPASACGVEHSYAVGVAAGKHTNNDYFSYVCAMDEDDNPREDEDCWIKTNPSLPALPGHDYIRSQLSTAAGMPSKLAMVDRLLFCSWSGAERPWIDYATVIAAETDGENMGRTGELFVALDLSAKKDLTAAAAVWRAPDGGLTAEVKVWTPADTLSDRAKTDNTPYLEWAEAGHIEAVPGATLDYSAVATWLARMNDAYDLKALAYDPWRIDVLVRELAAFGLDASRTGAYGALRIVPHPQGFVAGAGSSHKGGATEKLWMPRSIDALEDHIINGTLRIVHNPCVRAALLGCVAVEDASRNRRFNKNKAQTRIDPAVALTMAVGLASTPGALTGSIANSLLEALPTIGER